MLRARRGDVTELPTPTDRRLLLGPPAAGLSARILEELAARLTDAATDPGRLLVIVPNHAAVQNCMRRLQQRRDLPAIPECIVPLSKLPHHWGHIAPGRGLPPLLGTLLLRAALEEVEAAIRREGREALLPARRTGVLSAVRAQIRECKQAGFLPATVSELAWNEPFAQTASRFPWTPLERALTAERATHRLKLLDQFRQVWIAYERRLHADRRLPDGGVIPGWLDSADQLLAGAAAFEQEAPSLDWLAVDGFIEFTALQWRLLQPLLGAATVRFTLPVDRLDGGLFDAEADPRRWFSAMLSQDRFFEIERIEPDPEAPLARLQEALPQVTQGMPLAPEVREALAHNPALEFRQPADRPREVASVLRDIVRRMQADTQLRYRDHVLIARDLASYRPLLVAEAAALHIPLQLLHPRSLDSHPLGQCWERAAQLLVDPEWTREGVLGVLQPLAISGEHADALGKFQLWLATQPAATSPGAWRGALAAFADAVQEADGVEQAGTAQQAAPLLEPLRWLLEAWSPTRGRLIPLAVGWVVEALIPAWLSIADPEDGESGAAATALCEVASLLLSLDEQGLLGEASTLDVGRIIGLALSETTYEPKDTRREVLRVADAERARDLEAAHVAILGLTLGSWPGRPSPQPFFDDPLRMLLSEYQRSEGSDRRPRADAWTRPDWHTESTTTTIEGLLFRVACGRARSRLSLSAPASEKGTAQEPSPWFATLLPVRREGEPSPPGLIIDPDGQRLVPFSEWIIAEDAAQWLACYRHTGIEGRPKQAIATRHAIAQLGSFEGASSHEYAAALADRLLTLPPVGGVVTASAGRWSTAPARLAVKLPRYNLEKASPSSLNDLAQCAFKHFAQRVCHLTELDPPLAAGLDPMKRGSVLHAALETWTREHPDLDPDALLTIFDQTWLTMVHTPESALYGPQRAAMARRLGNFTQVEESGWPWKRLQSEAEVEFGRDEPFVMPLPDGRRFTYTGKIDRVDTVLFEGHTCLVLMDYKNSKSSLIDKEGELLAALGVVELVEDEPENSDVAAVPPDITLLLADVQLPLYAYAMATLRDLPILAAFHYPLGKPEDRQYGFVPGRGSWRIADWLDVEQALTLPTPNQWQTLVRSLTTRIGELFDLLSARDIHPKPLFLQRCGPGRCAYSRLCRYPELPLRGRW